MIDTLSNADEDHHSTLIVDGVRIDLDYDDSELRESLQSYGWVEGLPALRDEYGVTLVGRRRLKIAEDLGIQPVIRTLPPFGQGAKADAERLKLAIVSNIGSRALTPRDRQRIAEHLYGKQDWTMARIAEALGVSQPTITNDLRDLSTTNKSKSHAKTDNNPKGSGRPKGSGKQTNRSKPTEDDSSGDVIILADAKAKRESLSPENNRDSVQSNKRPNIGSKIRDKFGDGKWHKLQAIIEHVGTEETVRRTLATMEKDPNVFQAKAEHKKVGKDTEYRIWRLDTSKVIAYLELFERLDPIIKALEIEGRKNMSTMAPANVAVLAGELRQLLDGWAK